MVEIQFSPVAYISSVPCFWWHTVPDCLHFYFSLRDSASREFFPRCTAGPKLVRSCCIRLHTTANKHATTPNIVGATMETSRSTNFIAWKRWLIWSKWTLLNGRKKKKIRIWISKIAMVGCCKLSLYANESWDEHAIFGDDRKAVPCKSLFRYLAMMYFLWNRGP